MKYPYKVLGKMYVKEPILVLSRLQMYLQSSNRFIGKNVYFITFNKLSDLLFLITGKYLKRKVDVVNHVSVEQVLRTFQEEEEDDEDDDDDDKDEEEEDDDKDDEEEDDDKDDEEEDDDKDEEEEDDDKDEEEDDEEEDEEDEDEEDEEEEEEEVKQPVKRVSKRKAASQASKRIRVITRDEGNGFDPRNAELNAAYTSHRSTLRDHTRKNGQRGKHIGAGTGAGYDRSF